MNEIHYITPTSSDLQLPVYLTGVGRWDNQEAVHRSEGYHEYQFSMALSGEGELHIGDDVYRVQAGDGFFLPPRIGHCYFTVREPWEVLWMTFDGHYAETLVRLSGLLKAGVVHMEHHEPIMEGMQRLLQLGSARLPGHGDECCKQAFSLLLDIRKQIVAGSAASYQSSERLQPVLRHIDRHVSRSMPLGELADVIRVTPQHLCLLFKKTFQLRPTEYINKVRVNKSKELLISSPHIKMHALAREVGFDNPGYFNTVFRQHTGMTPSEFRRNSGI